jgi:hypothetical protein
LKLDVVEKDASGEEHFFFVRDRSKGFYWFFNFVMKLERGPIWVAPLIAIGVGAFVLVALDVGGPMRTLFVATFAVLGPGAGMARVLHLRSPVELLALVVPFSLACTVKVSATVSPPLSVPVTVIVAAPWPVA